MFARRLYFDCPACLKVLPQVLSSRKHYISRWSSLALSCRMATLAPISSLSAESRFKHFEDLREIAPGFHIDGSKVFPILEPTDFYDELKHQILAAKSNIFIAALYIGTSEQELIDTISLALSRSTKLHVHILIDCLRGTRTSDGESSATLLLHLIQRYPGQVRVDMYHTPDLKGIVKWFLPQRFNEGIGLMHIKAFGFDDNLILSGANLSDEYFTDRQDRYMLFNNSPQLTAYFFELVKTIGSFSYSLSPSSSSNNQVGYDLTATSSPDPVMDSKLFKIEASSRIRAFISKWMANSRDVETPQGHDTLVIPVVQMGPLGIYQDQEATLKVFELADAQGRREARAAWEVILTSGYFNFTKEYTQRVLETHARFRLLTASPEANGFFYSNGISKYIPQSYTLIERKFHDEVVRSGRRNSIKIEEYNRPGWTYHAKGLWIYFPGDMHPTMTMIGSPNFGYRSNQRDLEAQVIVVTENNGLRLAIHEELISLGQHTNPVNEKTFERSERRVPFLVNVATFFIRTML